ncbi:uncharacterized protein LOC128265265 [Drosophila gunungcola]|uniref:Transcription factor BTF3 n=1 Tax=Drosophila gunungcola TaxID=103775 RepID=A0A9Q0BJB1_9MUSC|nr:uncharacterized protein LOC128265265 [Drosophila gunungcola]XP_052857112.1 uncharacterized protein LOC128265265 [Drosophila gunungcola]XP_052857113.1 uncharacterized protein LOC128265265 [Drosophila gunungcola]KAI8033740.1 hypothetical protein M5D96_013497 [Drosophila gunungcola]
MDLNKLKKMEMEVRIGGKGSVRRKHKHIRTSPAIEEKRLQTALSKLNVSQVPAVHEVTIEMADSSEIQVLMPKVQVSTLNNLFVINGEMRRHPPVHQPEHQPERPKESLQSGSAASMQMEPPQKAKKPKKPRCRLRYRNKLAKEMLERAEQAGDIATKDGRDRSSQGESQEDDHDRQDGQEGQDGQDGGGDGPIWSDSPNETQVGSDPENDSLVGDGDISSEDDVATDDFEPDQKTPNDDQYCDLDEVD